MAGITIYPPEYFCPQNVATGEMTVTENTYSIHHYSASWFTKWDKKVAMIERCKNRNGLEFRIRRLISLPFRVICKIDKLGFKKTVRFIISKFWKK